MSDTHCPKCEAFLYKCIEYDDGGNTGCPSCKAAFHRCPNGNFIYKTIRYSIDGDGPAFCKGCGNDDCIDDDDTFL